MRSLLWGAAGALTLSMLGMGACGGSADSTPGDSGADARARFEAGVPDTYIPYTPLTTRCVAAPYADAGGGVVPFDAGDVDAGDTDAGPPLGPPQLVSYGGRILHDPRVVPITYLDDDMADQIEDFVGSFGCTSYWRSVVSEYGVNQAEMLTPVRLTDAAPTSISDSQIASFLEKQINSGAAGFAKPPADVIFALYFPVTTTIDLFGEQSCQSFDGYHSSLRLSNGTRVSYAVMARCNSDDIDQVTGTSSHEFVEATTDADPETAPAYLQPDADHIAFSFLAGGEAGDLCTYMPDAMFTPDSYPFVVQRTWSNVAVAGGHDPCVPAPTTPFVSAIPDQPDTIPVQNTIASSTTRGIAIPVGGQRTIDVHLASEGGANVTWTIDAKDASQFSEGTTHLSLSLDTDQASNGGVAHLTITRQSKGTVYGAEPFTIHSHYTGRDAFWTGVVGDPM